MEAFESGDRVVAVDVDMTRMIRPVGDRTISDHYLPDGAPQKGVVYHVRAVKWSRGGQGLFITGLRGLYGNREIPWGAVRFRKLDFLKGHAPKKEKHKQPDTMKAPVMAHSVDVPLALPQGASA